VLDPGLAVMLVVTAGLDEVSGLAGDGRAVVIALAGGDEIFAGAGGAGVGAE
jgi:hypothetical protein